MAMSDQEKSGSRSAFVERHPVTTFFTLAFLISWGGVFAITLPTGIPGQGEAVDRLYGLVFLPMLAGPFLSALILSAILGGRSDLAALLRRLFIWRAGLVEYVVSFALIPACALTVLLSISVVSPEFEPGFLASDSGFATFAPMLLMGFAVGLIEETGWTSFATSRLLHGRGVLTVAVSLGIVLAMASPCGRLGEWRRIWRCNRSILSDALDIGSSYNANTDGLGLRAHGQHASGGCCSRKP